MSSHLPDGEAGYPSPHLLDLSAYEYDLPSNLIAQTPAEPRDAARLLVVDRTRGTWEHRVFHDIPAYLSPGDALVLNDTRVIPARLLGKRATSGGQVEIFLLRRLAADVWRCLVRPGRRLPVGSMVVLGNGQVLAEIAAIEPDGERVVRFSLPMPTSEMTLDAALFAAGEMPLPPYIHQRHAPPARYQTVYAQHDGSVAAPTAGLHFTPSLLSTLAAQGVGIHHLTLHVGAGTFKPVQAPRITDHTLHAERAWLGGDTATRINAAHSDGHRVIAVGTTSLRTLESAATPTGDVAPFDGETNLFIFPGYRFRTTDALLTNFHLPRSSLLMLVGAFMGYDLMRSVYAEAIRTEYRFYSFGDAMLIL